jgi:hypothetical protein
MTNKEINKAILAGIEGKALYLGSTLVWRKIIEDNFDTFKPELSTNRLVEPTTSNYGILHNTDNNSNRLWFLSSATTLDKGILKLSTRPKNQDETFNRNYVASFVYSKKMFSKGKLDIRAKFTAKDSVKCSLWCMTTPATESITNLKYVHEYDIVEYMKKNQGIYNTSRGMWTWQENAQSIVPAEKLPKIFVDPTDGKKHSYSYSSWDYDMSINKWIRYNNIRVIYDGNALKGNKTGKYYFVTNSEYGVGLDYSELTWIDEDGNTGTGFYYDGEEPKTQITDTEFWRPSTRKAIGGGEDTSILLDGTVDMREWHTWSIVFGEDYVAYQCDGQEYWRKTNNDLYRCVITDDMKFSIIFSVINANDPTNETDADTGEVDDGRGTMEVDWIKFTFA